MKVNKDQLLVGVSSGGVVVAFLFLMEIVLRCHG